MSISTFQEKVFKSGCGIAVLGLSAVAMAMGLFYTSCDNRQQMVDEGARGPIAVQIGEVAIPAAAVQQQAQQMMMGQQDANPKMQIFGLAQALQRAVQDAAQAEVLRRVGVDTSDEAVRAQFTKQLDDFVKNSRQTLIDGKQLKANATEAEYLAAFKKQYQESPDDYKKKALENLAKALANPAEKQAVLTNFGPQLALDKLKEKYTVSPDQVKAGYDSLTMKRILVSPRGRDAAAVDAEANKILGEIKGGLSFEQAMDKYSNDLPAPKKKVSESVVKLNRRDLEANKAMAPLLSLKAGETSGLIEVPEGKAIYKLVSVKNEAPADFDKNVKKYTEDYASSQAQQELRKLTDDIVKSDLVKYPLPGFKVVNDYFNSMMNPAGADTRKIADEAKAAMKNADPADDQAALLVWYAAVDDLWTKMKSDPAQQEAIRAERIEAIQAILQQMESFATRMELVDIGIETKNSELAANNLLEAAKLNNTFEAEGERRFREIASKLAKAQADKVVSADQAKLIVAEQDRWRGEKLESDKQKKAFEAEQAIQKKKDEEAKKKFDAEQKKMADQVKKDQAGTTTGGAQPPKTTTGGQ